MSRELPVFESVCAYLWMGLVRPSRKRKSRIRYCGTTSAAAGRFKLEISKFEIRNQKRDTL